MQESDLGEDQTLRAELARLRIKRTETKDKDIRAALDDRIQQLEAQIKPLKAEEDDEPDLPAEPPTPEQMAEAEQCIRQARVEKMRGNTRGAGDLMQRASEVAPGSPTVLEALGDDLVERKQYAKAKKAYQRAWKLDEKNVGLERKFATIVAQMDAMGSIDDQLRMNLSDSPFITEGDAIASAGAATLLSAIFPGLGHAVLGRRVGYAIMATWILCLLWLFVMQEDLIGLFTMVGANRRPPNLVILIPLLIASAVYLGTLASLKSARKEITRKRVERPRPPVDLPFE
jgi:hypothetical protein